MTGFKHLKLIIACAGVLTYPAVVNVAHAESVYKLTNEGLTTYQDRAPDSSNDNGHKVLNNQGVVLQEVKSREDRIVARRVERERELSKIRDRVLLATFTSEEDLIQTRDDRVGMIDSLISRLDDRIRVLSERLDVVGKRVLIQEKSRGDGAAPESLYEEQLTIQRNIENAWSLIDAKASERSDISAKFEGDLLRYRELKFERTQRY